MTVSTNATEDLGAFTADWEDWHRQQETRLADPHGFLAVTSLHWLSETPQRFHDAPGAGIASFWPALLRRKRKDRAIAGASFTKS
jgi:uncharacterized protein (DUF1684 family)